MKLLLNIILICCLPIFLFGQEKEIDLKSVISMTGSDNLNIREANYRFALAEAETKLQKEWWIPNLNAGVALHQRNGSVMNGDGRFFLDINRQNFDAGIGLELNLDFSKGLYGAKGNAAQSRAAKYTSSAIQNKATLASVHAYLDLLAAKAKINAFESLAEQSASITDQLQVQYEAGLINKSQVLLSKSSQQRDQLEAKKATMDYTTNAAQLIQLLNLAPETVLTTTEEVEPLEIVPLTDLDKGNPENRPEYKSLQENLSALGKWKSGTGVGRLLPTLRLAAYESLYGDIFSPTDIQNMETGALNPTFNFNGAIQWNIPLSELTGGGQKNLLGAKEELIQVQALNQLQMSRAEMAGLKAELEMSKDFLDLAENSRELAKLALEQSIERQKLRKAQAFEVLQAQDYYVKALIEYIDAVTNYNKAQYSWLVASGKGI